MVAEGVEAVALRCGFELLDHFVLEIVDDIAVAVDDHAAVGAKHRGATRAIVDTEPVAALSLPDDALPSVEDEGRFLGVGELPVIRVVEASTGGDDAGRIVDAEQP